MNYNLQWQIKNEEARENTDLCCYNNELINQMKIFNSKCKSGKIKSLSIHKDYIEAVYSCNKKLTKPGAALHAYSQGLVDNYIAFTRMLTESNKGRLFENK